MASVTARLGLRKPSYTDFVDVVTDLDNNYDKLDLKCAVLDKTGTFTALQEFSATSGAQAAYIHGGGGSNPGGTVGISVGNPASRCLVLKGAVAQAARYIEVQKSDGSPVLYVNNTGAVQSLGQSNFGEGTFGGDAGYLRAGNLADDAYLLAGHGVEANASLLLRAKGTGSIKLQSGLAVDVLSVDSGGRIGIYGGANVVADVGPTGGAEALPLLPDSYLVISVSGLLKKIPLFNE